MKRLKTAKVYNNDYNNVDIYEDSFKIDFRLFQIDDNIDFNNLIEQIHEDITNSTYNYINDVTDTLKQRVKKDFLNDVFGYLYNKGTYRIMDLFLGVIYYFDLEILKMLKLLSNYYKNILVLSINKELTNIKTLH